jgi:glycosyltransferase involved in cell wall biosynthesis
VSARRLQILHCHSTFALGGKEARAVRLMNAFGDAAAHTILSATDDLAARDAIDPGIEVDFPRDAPSLTGKPSPGRYRQLARYVRDFDLVLTYNWGSMDAVGARRLFPRGAPPLIHHEDGFNADEAVTLNWKRNAFRRLVLPAAEALVVPSVTLEHVARTNWGRSLPIRRISNGISTARYAAACRTDAIPGFQKKEGEVVVGTVAGLRPVKDLPSLVAAFATMPSHCQLVIVGTGPERDAILAAAMRHNVADRVHLPGFLANPWSYIGLFDIMALTSLSEQQPIAVMEGMAAGLPIVATDVGDVSDMISSANQEFIGDELVLREGLSRLAGDAALRRQVGAANRDRAAAQFDEAQMISAYKDLYWSVAT